MKQCPNPDCMLYTRLEELPDAYVKCPGCNGPLEDVDVASGLLSRSYTTRRPLSSSLLQQEDEYGDPPPQPYDAYQPQQLEPAQQLQLPNYEQEQGYVYGDEYAYDEADPYATAGRRGLSTSTRAVLVGGVLLMLVVCGLAATLLMGSLSARSSVAAGPQATQTALASLRPAANSPVALMPGAPSLGLSGTGGQQQASNGPRDPPSLPSDQVQSTPPVLAGAIQAQAQPVGGVLDAHMSVSLEGGEPVGSTSVYGPDDSFHLAVQANFGAGGVTTVLTRWYGPGGSQIYELRREHQRPGTYYVGFTLKKSDAWAAGDYRVDIYTNDSPTPAYSVHFSVQ